MPDHDYDPLDPFLRRSRVLQLLGIDAATLDSWIKEGRFPQPTILNAGSRRELPAWPLSTYEKWRSSLPQRQARPMSDAPRKKKPKIERPDKS